MKKIIFILTGLMVAGCASNPSKKTDKLLQEFIVSDAEIDPFSDIQQ